MATVEAIEQEAHRGSLGARHQPLRPLVQVRGNSRNFAVSTLSLCTAHCYAICEIHWLGN